jgi:hypothetical protein
MPVQRVRGQGRPVHHVGGGFHDDDLIGLTSDVEFSLVRNHVEADERKRLVFIRPDIHRAADDARVAVKVGTGGSVDVVASVDAGGVGLQAQVEFDVDLEISGD